MTWSVPRCWVAVILLCGGCMSRSPVPIHPEHVPPARVQFQVSPVCGWTLHAVVDGRAYQRHVGPSLRTLDTTRIAEIVERGVADLGIVRTASVSPARPLTFTILHAYVDGIGIIKDAALVLRVTGPDGLAFTVRGVNRTSNWAGGDGEIQPAVGRMLDDALQRTYTALLAHCARWGGSDGAAGAVSRGMSRLQEALFDRCVQPREFTTGPWPVARAAERAPLCRCAGT